MEKNYNKMPARSPLSNFAVLPSFIYKLKFLAESLAENENWEYDSGYLPERDTPEYREARKKVGVLYQYIHHTFSKATDENKIIYNEEKSFAIMNTGLLTNSVEEIYMLFESNSDIEDSRKFILKGFYRESAHEIPINLRGKLPIHIDYFENSPEEMYFNVKNQINANVEHIVKENFDRLPESIKDIGDSQQIISLMSSLIESMKKRILRNHRLIVPQYYNNKIMYLAPLKFGKDIITLAIEKHEDTYRANTILTMGMAYCNARLIAKPESNWLIIEK